MTSTGAVMEEYLISSYPLPPSIVKQDLSRDHSPQITSPSYPANKSRSIDYERVLVTTPNSGLGVYDLTDQTALAAITLGPSFNPTTPAVARSLPLESADSIRVKHSRKTWVAVQPAPTEESASEQNSTGKGQVWQWTENERKDGSTDGEPDKIVYPISSTLSALQAPRSLPNHLLLLATSGSLALATSDSLAVVASLPTSSGTPTSQSLRAVPLTATTPALALLPTAVRSLLPTHRKGPHLLFVIRHYTQGHSGSSVPNANASLLSDIGKKKFKKTKRPSSAAVIDEAEAQGVDSQEPGHATSRTEIELVLLDPEVEVEDSIEAQARLVSLGSVEVGFEEAAEQVVVSDAGIITTLSSTHGLLKSWRIVPGFSTATAPSNWSEIFEPSEETVPSLSPAPIKTFPLSNRTLSPRSLQTRIIALHSSFVLLSSLKPADGGSAHDDTTLAVTSTVWDVRLGAVIAATTTSVPSAVTTSRSSVGISLSLPTPFTATLSLFPLSQSQQPSGTKAPGSTPTVSAGGRVVIFGLPLAPPVVPSASVLAAVVGKQSLTASFLDDDRSRGNATGDAAPQLVEPVRHPRTSGRKQALLDASAQARRTVLEQLSRALSPGSSETGRGASGGVDIDAAEQAFAAFVEAETTRLREYNVNKVRVAAEREKERRVAALQARDQSRTSTKKYELAKKRIDELISEEEAAGSGAGGKSWKEVTSKRIKGVSDIYRYKYYDERVALEAQMGQVTRDDSLEKALKAVEKQEPAMPSTFVTAVLRLCFPASTMPTVPGSASDMTALSQASKGGSTASTKTPQHPTGIVATLLARRLVGDGQVEGGVTYHLARAGDWSNILLALDTMPDIPESTTVSLLKQVVQGQQQRQRQPLEPVVGGGADNRAVLPDLPSFLASFLRAPSTPSTVRRELAIQLGATEALPVLNVLDAWLSWWTRRQPAASSSSINGSDGPKRSRKQRLAVDPFEIAVASDASEGEELPPTVDQIIPLVSALLDAHFVALLLDGGTRGAHKTLSRLLRHVQTHLARVDDLALLLGPLEVFARRQDEQQTTRRAAAAAAAEQRQRAAAASAPGHENVGSEGHRRRQQLQQLQETGAAAGIGAGSAVGGGGAGGAGGSNGSLGKSMEARIRAQEKHHAVGAYSLDRFYL